MQEPLTVTPASDEIIEERRLSAAEATAGLGHLGKDESGVRYAYLKLTVIDK